jgi:signal peptidase I
MTCSISLPEDTFKCNNKPMPIDHIAIIDDGYYVNGRYRGDVLEYLEDGKGNILRIKVELNSANKYSDGQVIEVDFIKEK